MFKYLLFFVLVSSALAGFGPIVPSPRLTDRAARNRFIVAGVNPGNPAHISFNGVRNNTVAGLETLKSSSKCPINIIGGMEVVHWDLASEECYSHGNGYKADISVNPCLDKYVTTTKKYLGIREDGAPMYESHAGNVYAYKRHFWDILFIYPPVDLSTITPSPL